MLHPISQRVNDGASTEMKSAPRSSGPLRPFKPAPESTAKIVNYPCSRCSRTYSGAPKGSRHRGCSASPAGTLGGAPLSERPVYKTRSAPCWT
jgi:hypothetical protein